MYNTVIITPEVRDEFGDTLPDWISVIPVSDPSKTLLIHGTLDLGESSSIALAMEDSNSLLILDDGKARRFARSLGLMLTGTLGVVYKAKLSGLIEEDMTTIITEFRQNGFRISPEIERHLI